MAMNCDQTHYASAVASNMNCIYVMQFASGDHNSLTLNTERVFKQIDNTVNRKLCSHDKYPQFTHYIASVLHMGSFYSSEHR